MSKPEWNKETPEWANWLAQDEDHAWCWYELEPKRLGLSWSPNGGRYQEAGNPGWKETLERRP